MKRLRNNFLIPNLFFASAWTFPGGGFEGSIMGGFLAALQMNRENIWSVCDDEKYVDKRIVPLLGRKKIDDKTLELSFEKPAKFRYQKGQYNILNIMKPKVTELDLPYRWVPVASAPEEDSIRFHIKNDGSSFSESCELIEVGEEATVFGPMG
jgi:predicted ferric reductase